MKGAGSRISPKYVRPIFFSLDPTAEFPVAKDDLIVAWWVTPPTSALPPPESVSAMDGTAAAKRHTNKNFILP
jgi:hypothetical protein